MREYEENASLQGMNTLGVDSTARYLYPLSHEHEIYRLCEFSENKKLPLIPLGAGSNVVFGSFIDAVVVPVKLLKKEVSVAGNDVLLTVGAGCNWHETVRWTLERGYYGLENLSLIPGTVGAAPIQNIGAYGVEVKDYIVCVRGFYCPEKRFKTLSSHECQFEYRNSVFKHFLKNNFIITEVTFRLKRTFTPNLAYPDLAKAFPDPIEKVPLTGLCISNAVCQIRRKKLPDTLKLGNAGSFFKNPVIDEKTLHVLRKNHRDIIAYPMNNGFFKIAAGWLIDACGLKGCRMGEVGVYEKQALVLVNHGCADGEQIIAFADMIRDKVFDVFNIELEIEPSIYPASM